MFLIDQRYLRYFDWLSFVLTCFLSGIGLILIYSATYKTGQPYSLFFKKQALGILSGLGIYFAFCGIDYRVLCRWGYFLYWVVIGLLLFTLIKGSVGMGAQRWINLFFIKFQPSELAKLFLPAYITYYFYTQKNFPKVEFKEFLPILTILGVSFLLILKQPDLGTALIVLISGFLMIWFVGMPQKFFIYLFFAVLMTTPITWHFLKPYQQKRIAVFLGQGEMYKERYQIEQSKIAIGSGGLFGKGFLEGTQNKFMFLPESRTDFIFSVIGEEFGFVGALGLLLLFIGLFWRLCWVIMSIQNISAQLLAVGLLLHIVLSVFINIGMVIGLLPIVGIPLPFISYGITNLWINFASLGWLNGIAMRRFDMGVGV
jgi:rod shape determining protein RodA